jgi:hypothetical protein
MSHWNPPSPRPDAREMDDLECICGDGPERPDCPACEFARGCDAATREHDAAMGRPNYPDADPFGRDGQSTDDEPDEDIEW